MARNETILTVFVASPGDVSEERVALEGVVSELNKTWRNTLKLSLELVRWETDVYPNFGDCPQDVINTQIDDGYDIFLAIFWGRIGSPTKNASSGTMEELNRAIARHKACQDELDILVYFKDKAIPPSKIDTEQMKQVQDVRDSLGGKGGLYWDFESTEDFESLVRGHLSRVAQSWSQRNVPELDKDNDKVSTLPTESLEDDDDEYGFLDFLNEYEENLSKMNESLGAMSSATIDIGLQFNQRVQEVKDLSALGRDGASAAAKKVIKAACENLDSYSSLIDKELTCSTKARSLAFEYLSKAISLSIEFGVNENEVEELRDNLLSMISSADDAKSGLVSFRENIVKLPRLTIQMNKSKRRTIRSLDNVIQEVSRTISSAEDVLMILDSVEIVE